MICFVAGPASATTEVDHAALPMAPGVENRIDMRAGIVGLGVSIPLHAGQGLVVSAPVRPVLGGRLLCRLRVRLEVSSLPMGAEGTVSMAINHRTCLQAVVTREATGVSVNYLGLIDSQDLTIPVGASALDLDMMNFAQDDERPTVPALVTVQVDEGLQGLSTTVLPETSVLESTAPLREVEIRGAPPSGFSLRSRLRLDVTRAGGWEGPTGSVSMVVRRPDNGATVLARTFSVTSAESIAVNVDLRDVPPGTYFLDLGASGFNAPSSIQILRKSVPSPRPLVLLVGCVLVIVGVARPLVNSGRLGRAALLLLIVGVAVVGVLYGLRLADGEITVQPAPSQQPTASGPAATPRVFPTGSTESYLDGNRDLLETGADGVGYVYPLVGAVPDGAKVEPPTLTPVCMRPGCSIGD